MIVVGLGFGDEGKGLTTSYLCSKKDNPIVVRFNGGHQAGHTVIHEGHRHIFSSFGSGTLQGVPTYWAPNCTIHPTGLMHEYEKLKAFKPVLYVHPLCPITTPWDVKKNQNLELLDRNGSVGVGFGATIQRQEDHYNLFARDVFYPNVFRAKLENIMNYYNNPDITTSDIAYFMKAVDKMTEIVEVDNEHILRKYDGQVIFEGAQGLLLDQRFGFFPNVTRSNTGCKNARMLASSMRLDCEEVYYVTRCYQTRHGNGFMSNETDLALVNTENETNVTNDWQGRFRTGEFDHELINYALECDDQYAMGLKKNLVITCTDQRPDLDIADLLSGIKTEFNKVFISKGPTINDIEEFA